MRFPIFLLFMAACAHAALAPEPAEKIRGLLRDKKLAEAEAAAKALVAANAKEAGAHALLGAVRLAQGDSEAAAKIFEKAVELDPKRGEYRRQVGEAYGLAAQKASMLSKIGFGKKSLAAYEKAVELDPADLTARATLASIYQQAPAMMGGGADKAYAQAAEIKKLDATRGRIAYALLYAGDKKFAEAFAEIDAVLKDAPDHYPALFQAGRVAALSGDRLDRGVEALKKCLALPPPAGSPGHDAAHWRLGNLWERKGDKPAARAAYQAALAVNPNFPQAIEALRKLN